MLSSLTPIRKLPVLGSNLYQLGRSWNWNLYQIRYNYQHKMSPMAWDWTSTGCAITCFCSWRLILINHQHQSTAQTQKLNSPSTPHSIVRATDSAPTAHHSTTIKDGMQPDWLLPIDCCRWVVVVSVLDKFGGRGPRIGRLNGWDESWARCWHMQLQNRCF